MDFSNSYEKIKNSVVNILALQNGQTISSGTGIIIGDGNIAITCAHCIIDNTQIVARFSGSSSGFIGNIKIINRELDIAVLVFPQVIGPGVKTKDSSSIKIGNEAFVVGFPNNINKITALSANIAGFEEINNYNFIRIDCSVNHGNSGGPLFNCHGELIGIVNAKHGSLSQFLIQVQNARPGASMTIGGINPVATIQKLIEEMQKNLNLGIGYAIPINIIGEIDKDLKPLILY